MPKHYWVGVTHFPSGLTRGEDKCKTLDEANTLALLILQSPRTQLGDRVVIYDDQWRPLCDGWATTAKFVPVKESRFLCVRQGLQDNYNNFDSLSEAADYLASGEGTGGPLKRVNTTGVESPRYRGANYISLYWADEEHQPIGDGLVSDEDLAAINEMLKVAGKWEDCL
jgi:hypothetical protein